MDGDLVALRGAQLVFKRLRHDGDTVLGRDVGHAGAEALVGGVEQAAVRGGVGDDTRGLLRLHRGDEELEHCQQQRSASDDR